MGCSLGILGIPLAIFWYGLKGIYWLLSVPLKIVFSAKNAEGCSTIFAIFCVIIVIACIILFVTLI